jgi:hypothetical protein
MLIQLPSPTPTWLTKISENISDPSWWFTAFLVAVIASILAAYIKELLGRLISRLSSRFRVWWQRRRFRVVRAAHEAARDTHIILFLIFQSTFLFFGLLTLLLMLLFMMGMSTLQHDRSTFVSTFILTIILSIFWGGYMLGKGTSYILLVWRVHMAIKRQPARDGKK